MSSIRYHSKFLKTEFSNSCAHLFALSDTLKHNAATVVFVNNNQIIEFMLLTLLNELLLQDTLPLEIGKVNYNKFKKQLTIL